MKASKELGTFFTRRKKVRHQEPNFGCLCRYDWSIWHTNYNSTLNSSSSVERAEVFRLSAPKFSVQGTELRLSVPKSSVKGTEIRAHRAEGFGTLNRSLGLRNRSSWMHESKYSGSYQGWIKFRGALIALRQGRGLFTQPPTNKLKKKNRTVLQRLNNGLMDRNFCLHRGLNLGPTYH